MKIFLYRVVGIKLLNSGIIKLNGNVFRQFQNIMNTFGVLVYIHRKLN